MVELTYLFTAVLAVASLVDADGYCQLKSCDGEEHTMCRYRSSQPARQCVDYKTATLTPQEQKEVLDLHNKLRAHVASGRETRGIAGPQPAGIIPPLRWDEELATIAQRWANQCHFGHDSCRNVGRFQVGQNVGYKGSSGGYTATLSDIVNAWYNEVDKFDRRSVPYFRFDKAIGHYSQIVWGKTSTIGCGLVKYFKDNQYYSTYLVCNYGEAGNMEETPMYETRQGSAAGNQQQVQRNSQTIPQTPTRGKNMNQQKFQRNPPRISETPRRGENMNQQNFGRNPQIHSNQQTADQQRFQIYSQNGHFTSYGPQSPFNLQNAQQMTDKMQKCMQQCIYG